MPEELTKKELKLFATMLRNDVRYLRGIRKDSFISERARKNHELLLNETTELRDKLRRMADAS